jgi:hypothetical protein
MPSKPERDNPPVPTSSSISSDTMALASHMDACQRSHGPFHHVLATLDRVQALASGRIVTTGALFSLAGLGLLLALH